MCLHIKLFATQGHSARFVLPDNDADGVECQLKLRRGPDHHGGEWFLLLAPFEGECQSSAPTTKINLGPVTQVVDL